MASVLASLKPFVALLGQAPEPRRLAERLVELAHRGAAGFEVVQTTANEVTDQALVESTLTHAGILTLGHQLSDLAPLRLAQAQVMLELAEDDRWELVLTVPSFLRSAVDQLVDRHGYRARPRETGRTIGEVAATAQQRLVIAAPYLQTGFVTALTSHVDRVLRGGGTAMVITRALSLTSPTRSSANIEAVALLRAIAEQAGGRLLVRSWEETGLGIHFKVVIADERVAYLGSANLTPGGMLAHAEAGVLLRGSRVVHLSGWLDAVADQLAQRRLPAG